VEGLALPKSAENGNFSLNKSGIRWMSDKNRLDDARARGTSDFVPRSWAPPLSRISLITPPSRGDLARQGQDFEAQAFRYRRQPYGFQFHPEVTFAMLCRWMLLTRERMGEPGARPRHRHIEGWFRHDGAVARWSGAFLRRWLPDGKTARGINKAKQVRRNYRSALSKSCSD
jgi:hypothetical protein